jgi:hypothetical protein
MIKESLVLDDSFSQFLKEDSKKSDIQFLEPDQKLHLEKSL